MAIHQSRDTRMRPLLTDTVPLLDHFTITLKSPYNQSLNQVS